MLIIGLAFLFSAVPALAAGKPDPKVNICHLENKNSSNYHLINVSLNAQSAHLKHGDGLPGEAVPNMTDKKFSEDCSIVDIVPACTPGEWIVNNEELDVHVIYSGDWYYTATFSRSGNTLMGDLTDPYVQPSSLTKSITNGSIVGNHVIFSFDYGAGSVQGVRTYEGDINSNGDLIGTWSQTGSQSTGQSFAFTIVDFATLCGGEEEPEPQWHEMESLTIPCSSDAKIESTNTLTAGTEYKVEASGTCNWRVPPASDGYEGDAQYWLRHDAYGEGWTNTGIYSLAMWNGATPVDVDWGSFDATHVYTKLYSPSATEKATFFFYDDNYGDNSGSLTVKIFNWY